MMSLIIVLLLYQFVSPAVEGRNDHLADVLTVAQRLDLFGTYSSMNLPDTEFVTVLRLDVNNTRQPNIKRYEIRYKGETMNFTLKHDDSIFSPGCMVHHHPSQGSKILYPCSRNLADCFYTGYGDADHKSWIAANTCRGLKGVLTIGGSTLIIAPFNQQLHGNHGDQLHMVYNYVSNKATWEDTVDDKVPESKTGNRSKRSVDGTRYIETRVVVEPQVHWFHNNESEEYVRTVFNIASRLFEDKSFGTNIKLCLMEIHIYESLDRIGVPIVPAADKTLDSFCEWIAKNATTKTDCTLLLTKVDLRYEGSSSTVGLANSKGMCALKSNCLVVEDVGPASGPIIAHEIGHLLGMKHIDQTPCKGQKGNMGVGITGPGSLHWTSCSAAAARDFISTSAADCLLNEPLGYNYTMGFNKSAPLPGVLYPKEKQCKLLLGPQARVCTDPFTGICGKLACTKTPESPCVVYDSNILDGTDCDNTRSFCSSGRCVPMTTSNSIPPVDGEWTEWEKGYSPCTRQCGEGVRIRSRRCENPRPQYGGKPCVGESIKAVLCNMEPCQNDFKTEQCQDLAHRKNLTGNWEKVDTNGDAGCLLWCQDPSGEREIKYEHDRPEGRYKDGSDCYLDTHNQYGRCVKGKCRSFGCDGLLDSDVVYNQCGVCGGNASQCNEAKGQYTKDDVDHVFKTVLTIPKGSYNVKVTQLNNYCFLSAVVNGKRVFNSVTTGMHTSGIYTPDGMRFQYTSKPERIDIDGPTTADVEIQVYRLYSYTKYMGVSPQIEYSYFKRSQEDKFDWNVRYSACSRSCGLGYRRPFVQCVEKSSSKQVEDKNCDIANQPSQVPQPCNNQHCSPTWMVSSVSQCSKTCGHDSYRNRYIMCGEVYNGSQQGFQDSVCSSQQKPSTVERCEFVPCPPIWKPGPWSQCSKTCGEGIRIRKMECYYTNGTKTDEKNCVESERPTSQQTCFHGYCPNTAYGNVCKDNVTECKIKYGADICYGKYATWAEFHCARSCQICSPDDSPTCGRVANVCVKYETWSAINCPKTCSKECKDGPHCEVFKSTFGDICQKESFKVFVQQHCPQMCHLCKQNNECKDKTTTPCSRYGNDACTNSKYRPYMEAHCANFCGFC